MPLDLQQQLDDWIRRANLILLQDPEAFRPLLIDATRRALRDEVFQCDFNKDNWLFRLPEPVLLLVGSNLDLRDIIALSQTCYQLYSLITETPAWWSNLHFRMPTRHLRLETLSLRRSGSVPIHLTLGYSCSLQLRSLTAWHRSFLTDHLHHVAHLRLFLDPLDPRNTTVTPQNSSSGVLIQNPAHWSMLSNALCHPAPMLTTLILENPTMFENGPTLELPVDFLAGQAPHDLRLCHLTGILPQLDGCAAFSTLRMLHLHSKRRRNNPAWNPSLIELKFLSDILEQMPALEMLCLNGYSFPWHELVFRRPEVPSRLRSLIVHHSLDGMLDNVHLFFRALGVVQFTYDARPRRPFADVRSVVNHCATIVGLEMGEWHCALADRRPAPDLNVLRVRLEWDAAEAPARLWSERFAFLRLEKLTLREFCWPADGRPTPDLPCLETLRILLAAPADHGFAASYGINTLGSIFLSQNNLRCPVLRVVQFIYQPVAMPVHAPPDRFLDRHHWNRFMRSVSCIGQGLKVLPVSLGDVCNFINRCMRLGVERLEELSLYGVEPVDVDIYAAWQSANMLAHKLQIMSTVDVGRLPREEGEEQWNYCCM